MIQSSGALEPIAIVGMGCRLPGGVDTPEALATFLRRHGDGIRDVPPDRYALDLHHDPEDGPGKVYVARGGFLQQDLFSFDPAPFGISPREAAHLDPQQRLLLEVAWEALEDAGIPLDEVRGTRTGVYVGGFTLDMQGMALDTANRHLASQHTALGATMTVLSARLAYTFDLRGPCLTIDTACSSSLVATHLACQAIREGTCERVLVGGVNAIVSLGYSLVMCKGHFLSPDGRCKAFDAAADGYGRGEGAGVVVLEPLERALAQGHRVIAVIHGSTINHDGRTEGMALPNEQAQAEASREVCARTGIDPARIGYVEAHGTGTRAGDPVEARALGEVYGKGRATPLLVGSIKTNVGHLEAAAGVAGLIKAALCVQRGEILPQRPLVQPNPDIPFEALGIEVAQEARPWPAIEGPRLAAINSFGYGGTNAHLVLGAYEGETPPLASSNARTGAVAFTLSAETPEALTTHAENLVARLRDDEAIEPDDVAYTLACRRTHGAQRAVVLADGRASLVQKLEALAAGENDADVVRGRAPQRRRCVWVYTGMGPQWWGMGQELLAEEPVFRRAVEEVDALFEFISGASILAEMRRGEADSRMVTNAVAQPANFVLQVGLVAVLRERGLVADAHLGHSVGEVAAAWASGALDLEQAVRVAHHRSQLQQRVAGRGTMLAAGISAESAQRLLHPDLDVTIAAFNAPRSVAFAGARGDLQRVAERLEAEGVFHRFMPVEIAYHSPHMDPLEDGFRGELASVRPRAPQAPLYSTLLGERVEAAMHDADYWWRNARAPVRLHQAVRVAIADGHTLFLEIGPHPVLGPSLREILSSAGVEGRTFFTCRRQQPECESLRRNLAGLHAEGASIDWRRGAPQGRFVDLPRYPFARKHLWVESRAAAEERLGRPNAHSLLQRDTHGPTPRWTTDLGVPGLRWIRDHRVDGNVVFPGAAHVEALLAASVERHGSDVEHVVESVELVAPLVPAPEGITWLSVALDEDGRARIDARVDEGDWTEHARGRIATRARHGELAPRDLAAMRAEHAESLDPEAHYGRLAALGLDYGPAFRTIVQLARRPGGVFGRLRTAQSDAGWWVHPTILDGALQALVGLVDTEAMVPMVPTWIERVRVLRPLGREAWFEGQATALAGGSLCGSVTLFDGDGTVLAQLEGIVCKPVRRAVAPATWFHADRFEPFTPESRTPTGTWALAGDGPLREALRDLLTPHVTVVDLDVPEVLAEQTSVDTVVFLQSESEREGDADTFGNLDRLLEIVRGLAGRTETQLCVVTRGAFAEASDAVYPGATALAGLARVAMTEHPELRVRLVDLPPGAVEAVELVAVLSDAREEEVALGPAGWSARRVVRPGDRNQAAREQRVLARASSGAFALTAARAGDLSSLVYRPLPADASLDGDWIEVEVEVASLNFKDVMKAMGMLSDAALESTYLGEAIGMEAVGRVIAAGPDVRELRVGDRVHALCPGALASRLRVREPYALRCRAGDDPAQAAGDFVFTTAWYALVHRAHLQPGERVLIHSGAGGVGLAAIQIARAIGAEIFATAGTEAKRAFLRGQGIRHVYDSRTLDFASEIRRDTGGQGIDVVLNALAGPAQRRSLELLAEGGRFVELGKQDIVAGASLGLLPFNRALAFIAVDLDRLSASRSDLYASLAQEVSQAFERGELRPLPTEAVPADRVEEAFRRLGSGEVIGKVVVDFRDATLPVAPGLTPRPDIRADRTYFVTGGLGGFGLRTARWLVERGARHLVLASRRGRPTPQDATTVEAMRAKGAEVRCEALDVCDAAAVQAMVRDIQASGAPLGGVFHAAMVLEDRPLVETDTGSLRRVLEPKAIGAWNLHLATLALDLDHFVTYGSVSAMVGNPGQGAYAAANAFLDGLVAHRRSLGLPGLAVSWGVLGEVGVVARNDAVGRHLQSLGLRPLAPSVALLALGRAMDEDFGRVGIIDIDWARWVRAHPETPWRRLELVTGSGDEAEGGTRERFTRALAGLPDADRVALCLQALAEAAGRVFRIAPEDVDVTRPLQAYGLDSLMAVELQVAIEDVTGVELSSMELLAGRPLDKLVDRVLERVEAAPQGAAEAATLDEAEDLRAWALESICVQPPYFAFERIESDGEWLRAQVDPVPPSPVEHAAVGVAETARHLAILGSCAVRRTMGGEGRIYYPVEAARMLEGTADAADAVPLSRVEVRARCLRVDTRASRAVAETELRSLDGGVLARFEMSYHVIPRAEFETLFADHARPTREAEGHDPYRNPRGILGDGLRRFEGASMTVELGEVEPAACLGHFVGYPAYPVSIMARDAIAAVAEAVRARHGDVRITVIGGEAQTRRFVFAGQSARLVVAPIEAPAAIEEAWRATIESEGEQAAWFDMHLALTRS